MPHFISKPFTKKGGLLTALTGYQDDRMRQIVREELANKSTHKHKKSLNNTKTASPFYISFISGFSDELIKIAQLTMSSVVPKPTLSSAVRSSVPRNTLRTSAPRYSQVNQAPQPGPAQGIQPVLNPPPVRG